MRGIKQFAGPKLVLGICNGFQVLLEAGLLPGAMLRNASLQFRSEWVWCRVERTDTPFTSACTVGQVLRLPIAHGEGNYVSPVDPEGVVLRYSDTHGQALHRPVRTVPEPVSPAWPTPRPNVFGLMPHPERAAESLLSRSDGQLLLESLAISTRQLTAGRGPWVQPRDGEHPPSAVEAKRYAPSGYRYPRNLAL